MDFNTYQQLALKTAIFDKSDEIEKLIQAAEEDNILPIAIKKRLREQNDLLTLIYPVLGLAGEAAEVANKAKKLHRDGDSPEKREAMAMELGDVMWYVAVLAHQLGYELDDLVQANILKLAERQKNGTLQGS